MMATFRRVGQRFRHEGGIETVEAIAFIGVAVALLVATMAIFSANGGQVGSAATAKLGEFITNGATFTPDPAVQNPFQPNLFQPGQPEPQVYMASMGVPTVAQASPAQISNFFANAWNSVPLWLQGALIALGGALVVGAIFVGLVAAGIITAVSLPVALVIAGVGLVLASVAGAIYAVVTGKVDVLHLLLIGAGVQFVTILAGIWIAVGGPAALSAWFTNVFRPWLTQSVNAAMQAIRTGWTWVTRQAGALWQAIRTGWTQFTTTVSRVVGAIGQAIRTVFTWIRGGISTVFTWVKNVLVQGYTNFVSKLTENLAKIGINMLLSVILDSLDGNLTIWSFIAPVVAYGIVGMISVKQMGQFGVVLVTSLSEIFKKLVPMVFDWLFPNASNTQNQPPNCNCPPSTPSPSPTPNPPSPSPTPNPPSPSPTP